MMKLNNIYHQLAKTSFSKAEYLLNEDQLVYTALELRRCVEALAYRRLSEYIDDLSSDGNITIWQPHKVLKAIESLDPDSSKVNEVSIFTQPNDGNISEKVFIGSLTPLSSSGLSKLYNRLSSYIHVPTFGKVESISLQNSVDIDLKEKLFKVMSDLKPAVESDLLALRFKSTLKFNCLRCNETILVNTTIRDFKSIIHCYCCDAPYIAQRTGEQSKISPSGSEVNCQVNGCSGSYLIWDDFKTKVKPVSCGVCGDLQQVFFVAKN